MATISRPQSWRVLVVEDNVSEMKVLSDLLEDEGFQVVGCASATEALDHLHDRDIGVAVVDLGLPDLTGNQFLARINELGADVRVIIYTGRATLDSAKEAVNLGAFAYVEKLTDCSELLRYVHRAACDKAAGYARELEAAVARRTEELARSVRELQDFASIVAHDLRSPLLTVTGYCQALRMEFKDKLGDEGESYCNQIVESAFWMNQLIDAILDYSRLARSSQPFSPVRLDAVLGQALHNIEANVRAAGVRIDAGPLPTVQGDAVQLAQLFQNLLDNAIKFRGEKAPIITVAAAAECDRWHISVQDNGIGIDPKNFDRIFQVFQRLHSRAEYAGTGIGLATAKKIVERHGGRIWVTSEPGKGTCFHFTLPREVEAG
ncbi:MAG: sensor histidine kinase [Pirellulales bacterium]